MKMHLLVLACLLLTVWLAPPVRGGETIVVTTSLLQDVVERLLPEDSGLQVFRLIPPGACPGHFDLQPSVRYPLVNARLLFRHEFQEALADKVIRSVKTIGYYITHLPFVVRWNRLANLIR